MRAISAKLYLLLLLVLLVLLLLLLLLLLLVLLSGPYTSSHIESARASSSYDVGTS